LQLYLTLWQPRTLEETRALEKPIIKHARKVLRKAWKKSAKLGQNLDRLNAEQRHEMRKALKNLRYQTEFFAPLFERRDTRRFIEQLKTLQDVFGYINDVRMASRLIEVQERRDAGIDAARAVAYTIGRHEAEAAHVWHKPPRLGKTWNARLDFGPDAIDRRNTLVLAGQTSAGIPCLVCRRWCRLGRGPREQKTCRRLRGSPSGPREARPGGRLRRSPPPIEE
jgi:hypothetical protein